MAKDYGKAASAMLSADTRASVEVREAVVFFVLVFDVSR